jgi:hypothetical protein
LILLDSSLGFLELFQTTIVVVHVGIPRSVALVLRISKLLEMVKDTGGHGFITVGKVFLQFISHSIVIQLGRSFQEHLSPISLEYQLLEAMRPSFWRLNHFQPTP